MDPLELIIIVGYIAWAFFSGFRVVSGFSEWLDAPVMPNRLVKIIVSGIVGAAIGFFYFVWIMFKFIFSLIGFI